MGEVWIFFGTTNCDWFTLLNKVNQILVIKRKQSYLNSMDSYKLKQMGLHQMSVPAIIIIIFWSRGLYIANGSFKADEGAWGVMGLPLWPASPSTVNKPPNLAMSPHTGLSMHSSHCVNGRKESGWVGRSRTKRWTDALYKENRHKLKYASNTYNKECSEHSPEQQRKMHPPAVNLNSFLRDPEPALHKLQLGILLVIQLANQEVNLTTH